MTIPVGTYANATDAILFAGRDSDKTLLAVGKITATTPSNATVGKIEKETTGITFTLYALQNDIAAALPTRSFSLVGPTSVGTSPVLNYATMARKDVYIGTAKYPVFLLPQAGYANATASSFTDTVGNILGEFTFTLGASGTGNSNFAGVVYQDDTWTATQAQVATTSATSGGLTNFVGATIDVETPTTGITAGTTAVGDSSGAKFRFLVDVSSTAAAGIASVSIEVPVVAISLVAGETDGFTGALTTPQTWNIKGGLTNGDADSGSKASNGTSADSVGGAVLLAVGGVTLLADVANVNVGSTIP